MKTSEFKAWFEGFAENLDGAPTKAQFAKIKAKVDEIDGTPVTERIYFDRYVEPWRPYWDRFWMQNADSPMKTITSGSLSASSNPPMNRGPGVGVAAFESHAAMREFGRMEASQIAA